MHDPQFLNQIDATGLYNNTITTMQPWNVLNVKLHEINDDSMSKE